MANMDFESKKGTLKMVYKMCSSEINKVREGADLFAKKAAHAYINVLSALENRYGTPDCFAEYDNTLSHLLQLAENFKKINLKRELSHLLKHITIDDDNDAGDHNKVIFESVEESIRNIQNKIETYTYPQPLYHKYTPGCKFNIIISHIKNSEQSLFYINDYGEKDPTWRSFLEHLQNYFNESPKPLNRVPEEGEVIGLHLNGYMFRIVREDGPIMVDNFKAYLIDVGEIISVTEDMYENLYVLSTIQQNYCAQAVLCKLQAVNSSTDINFKSYLEEHLNVSHKIVVNKRTNHMLYVNLLSEETNPFNERSNLDSVNSTQNHESITNPFRKLLLVEPGYVSQKSQSTLTEEVVNEETFPRNSGSIVPSSICFSGKQRETMTEEERGLLYEELPNTSNAMKAVMGYEPKDDKVICPHTEPGKDSCFKGSLCKFEHSQKLKDGWTRDLAKTMVDIPNKIVYPSKGETITLRVTHIINVEFMFAQIISIENKYKPTLNELILKMNAPENKLTYKKLTNLPARFQLILAKYKDNMWYRAKILNFVDDQMVKVFYVDYGNAEIVALDNIRQWERMFEFLPFQAILCTLDGVKEIPTKAVEAREFLRSKLMGLNKNIKALVTNNKKLAVRLFTGSHDKDISNLLIMKGYAKAFEYNHGDDQQVMPG